MQIILLPTIVPTRFSRKTKEKNKKNLLNVTKLSDLASSDADAAAPYMCINYPYCNTLYYSSYHKVIHQFLQLSMQKGACHLL